MTTPHISDSAFSPQKQIAHEPFLYGMCCVACDKEGISWIEFE